jgi:hypothetical protein
LYLLQAPTTEKDWSGDKEESTFPSPVQRVEHTRRRREGFDVAITRGDLTGRAGRTGAGYAAHTTSPASTALAAEDVCPGAAMGEFE